MRELLKMKLWLCHFPAKIFQLYFWSTVKDCTVVVCKRLCRLPPSLFHWPFLALLFLCSPFSSQNELFSVSSTSLSSSPHRVLEHVFALPARWSFFLPPSGSQYSQLSLRTYLKYHFLKYVFLRTFVGTPHSCILSKSENLEMRLAFAFLLVSSISYVFWSLGISVLVGR